MRATEIIATLQARGVTRHNEGGNIRIKGRSLITDQEKEIIRTHKTAFIKALEYAATAVTPIQTARPLVTNGNNNLGDFQTAMHPQALAVSNDANSLILKEHSALAVQIPLTQDMEPVLAENLPRDDAPTLAWSTVSAQESYAVTEPLPAEPRCHHCTHFLTGRYDPPLGECDLVTFEIVTQKRTRHQDEVIEERYRVQHADSRPTYFGCIEFQQREARS